MTRDEVLEIIKKAQRNGERANLEGAYLEGANLYGANLYGANLYGANLKEANLYGANLEGAYLEGANLYGANLYGAYLKGAYLYGAKGLETFRIVPEEGSFIGWKKLQEKDDEKFVIAKLEIPKNAERVNAYGSRKCRASSARVLSITTLDGKPYRGKEKLVGTHYNGVTYERGKLIKPDSFDPDPRVECSNGIHFFLTKQEAIDW